MPKAYYKHKLLLDEHLFQRRMYPLLNQHFDVKHIRDDLHQGGLDDPNVYKLAVTLGRIILTKMWMTFVPCFGKIARVLLAYRKCGHQLGLTQNSPPFSYTMAQITSVAAFVP